jgi:hypothetical protein
MKRSFKYILLSSFAVLSVLSGCDKGFDELNINQTAATNVNPVYLLNNAIVRTSHPGSVLVYEMAIVQQMVSPNSGVLAGGNFNQSNRDVTRNMWERYYRDVLKHTVDAMAKTKDLPARANLYNMARIWRAYTGMLLTDTYGDIPFSQAALGFLSTNPTPVYDSQEAVYNEILKELDEASRHWMLPEPAKPVRCCTAAMWPNGSGSATP